MDKPSVLNEALLSAAIEGLTKTEKTMEPKWFYDEIGSSLFEDITALPEYYPARTEFNILADNIDRLAEHVPQGAELVELGSGASTKTRLLLSRFPIDVYVPIDISAIFLDATATLLSTDYPALQITPVVGDFTGPLILPAPQGLRVAFFPGSTIGNLDGERAAALLKRVRTWPHVHAFILGVDLVKDEDVLIRAYDDLAGVTAAFNLNLLHRMNREIGANFQPDQFAHKAFWNASEARIEMYLVSLRDQVVHIGEHQVPFAAGETIHTESSRKFTVESLERLTSSAGWEIRDFIVDDAAYFGVAVLAPA